MYNKKINLDKHDMKSLTEEAYLITETELIAFFNSIKPIRNNAYKIKTLNG